MRDFDISELLVLESCDIAREDICSFHDTCSSQGRNSRVQQYINYHKLDECAKPTEIAWLSDIFLENVSILRGNVNFRKRICRAS